MIRKTIRVPSAKKSVGVPSTKRTVSVPTAARSVEVASKKKTVAVPSAKRTFAISVPAPETAPAFLGATKATEPPSLSSSDMGNTIVLTTDGIPGGVTVGDRLYGLVCWSGDITPPGDWTALLFDDPRFGLYRHIVQAGDPTEWTWTIDLANGSRSGVLLATRGGVEGNLTGIVASKTIPDVEATSASPLLLGFCTVRDDGNQADEDTLAVSPLVLRATHASIGAASYQLPRDTAVATETASAGTLSGRSFSNPGGLHEVAGLVLEVG